MGVLFIVFNLPLLTVVSFYKTLRTQYGVLLISLFNGVVSGVGTFSYGINRLVLNSAGTDEDLIRVEDCFQNPLILFLLWIFPMNALGLLVLSIDRFLIISFPLSYFRYHVKVGILLIMVAISVNAAIIFVVYYATLAYPISGTMVSAVCNEKQILQQDIYIGLAFTKAGFALFAVVLMFRVLVLYVKHHRTNHQNAFQDEEAVKSFKVKQMSYTKTMLMSCAATICLFIIPSLYSIVSSLFDLHTSTSTWVRFVSFLNEFNIPILLIYREAEIRCRVTSILNVFSKNRAAVVVSGTTLSNASKRHHS